MVRRKILIVDDEPTLVEMAKTILEETGCYEVVGVSQPEKALRAAQAFEPDLALLDIQMPGRDGSAVAADIEADPNLAHTKIVFFSSAITCDEMTQYGDTIGGYPYILKPVAPETLIKRVAEELEKS